MTQLQLGDGTTIHFDTTGDGPQVLIANVLYGHAGLFAGLVADLARDHRVITYDLRGTGGSSRHGPYEPAVDMADLERLLEHLGGVRVMVGIGDGTLRAVRVAAGRPDLVDQVVTPGTFVLASADDPDLAGMSASSSVLTALVTLLESDYRAGLRSLVESGNSGLTGGEIRERVERMVAHCPQDAALARVRAWRGDDAVEAALSVGGRLWVLVYPGNPWFPEELAGRMPGLLPEAKYEAIEDGPFTRPEQTAAVVRRITAGAGG